MGNTHQGTNWSLEEAVLCSVFAMIPPLRGSFLLCYILTPCSATLHMVLNTITPLRGCNTADYCAYLKKWAFATPSFGFRVYKSLPLHSGRKQFLYLSFQHSGPVARPRLDQLPFRPEDKESRVGVDAVFKTCSSRRAAAVVNRRPCNRIPCHSLAPVFFRIVA